MAGLIEVAVVAAAAGGVYALARRSRRAQRRTFFQQQQQVAPSEALSTRAAPVTAAPVTAAPTVDAPAEPPSAEVPPPEDEPPPPAAAPPVAPPTAADKLEEIWGIGPIYVERLNKAGIVTFAQLAALSPKELLTIVVPVDGAPRPNVEPWLKQAAQRANLKPS